MLKVSKKKKVAMEAIQAKPSRIREIFLLQALVIVAANLWIFWPALHGGWLSDDILYVSQNPLMHDPARLWKAWFAPGSFIEYSPIEQSVQWAQWLLWHDDTFGFHLTNLLLHICNSLLVWRLLSKFGLSLAWLGGLLFAIHPAQVESVAWVSELKNTLSLPPFLLAMCAWIDYENRGKRNDYFLALGLFLIAMLCKITMVMFPVVILLYAWWKRDKIEWSDLKASAPFFAISLVLGLATVFAGTWYLQLQHLPADVVPQESLPARLALAGLCWSFYFAKFFLPMESLPYYPQWTVDPSRPVQFLPWLILAGVIFWLWTKRAGWGHHVLLGLGFFLIHLLPFAGFIVTSFMNFTWVMDHFLYIPMIGLIGLVVAGLGDLRRRLPSSIRLFGAGIIVIVMGLMAWESHGYAGMFIDEKTLWTYTRERNPGALSAYINLGNILTQAGQFPEAIDQLTQALQINPHSTLVRNNLGNILREAGRFEESREQYGQSLKIDPDNAETHNGLGVTLMNSGRIPEAIEQYEQAIKINPDLAEAYNNLGIALSKSGRLPDAIEQFEQVTKINPALADGHSNLGDALLAANRLPEAIEQYGQAIKIDPNNAETHGNLGIALGQTGRVTEAIEQFAQALKINPDDADAHDNLGVTLMQTGRIPEAIEQFTQALKINPNDTGAQNQLARLQGVHQTAPATNPSAK